MPTRCARCGSLAGRGRDIQLPGAWVTYLQRERDLGTPVGKLSMPLCRECLPVVDDLREQLQEEETAEAIADRNALLDELEIDLLIDSGA